MWSVAIVHFAVGVVAMIVTVIVGNILNAPWLVFVAIAAWFISGMVIMRRR